MKYIISYIKTKGIYKTETNPKEKEANDLKYY